MYMFWWDICFGGTFQFWQDFLSAVDYFVNLVADHYKLQQSTLAQCLADRNLSQCWPDVHNIYLTAGQTKFYDILCLKYL